MFWVNKIVFLLCNPSMIGFVLIVIGWLLWERYRRLGIGVAVFGVLWLWFWSCDLAVRFVGEPLESIYPAKTVEETPAADAIVVLGGGMSVPVGEEGLVYPEMHMGADRVWHGARLWRAGKAPVVITSGTGTLDSDAVLLKDLGVPEDKIIVDNVSRNTEENAKFVREELKQLAGADSYKGCVILLVTSATHMRRAVYMYQKYVPEVKVVPAPTDFEMTRAAREPFSLAALIPFTEGLYRSSIVWKELIGYWGYRVLR